MGSRLKEEEKNERAIRALSKQIANKRCINCNSLGPQYVCLNFWTFICTTCSGIHREFTHRVKSVSMSKFTSSEVAALQSGGNERAKEIYFKEWDSQRQPLPDSSNVERLRDFIKSVYVDKRFSGERPVPRFKGGDQDDVNENRRPETRMDYPADSRSPSYEERYDERRAGGRRSNAAFEDRFSRFDERRSPARFETERIRYDKGYNDNRYYEEKARFENRERRYEDHYNGGLDKRFEERFTRRSENVHHHRELSGGSPPPIRSVKEILGDNIPPLRVEDHATVNSNGSGTRQGDKLHHTQDYRHQKVGSSSSFGSLDGNTPDLKRANSGSLIDFSAEPETPAVVKQPDPFVPSSTAQQETNASSNTGWAMFDTFNMTSAPSGITGIVNSSSVQVSSGGSQPLGASSSGIVGNSWSAFGGTTPKSSISLGSSNQAWNAFPDSTTINPVQPPASVPLQPIPSQESPGVAVSTIGPLAAMNPSKQRQEIPEDFFTSSVPGGNLHVGIPMAADNSISGFSAIGGVLRSSQNTHFAQASMSRNPFDIPDGHSSMQTGNMFPSLNSLQTALPNLNMVPMQIPGHAPQWLHSSFVPARVPPVGQGRPIMMMPSVHPGSMTPSFGAGNSGNFSSERLMNLESSLHSQGPLPFNPQGGFGLDSNYPNQGSLQLPQNMLRPFAGNSFGPTSLFHSQAGSQSLPQLPIGGNTFTSESLASSQVGRQHFPQNTFGRAGSNIFETDSVFSAGAQQLPTQGSFGANPFG